MRHCIPHEVLDTLAEQMLIAARETVDVNGIRTFCRPDYSRAPEAVKAALDALLGPLSWEPYQAPWPKPEQMAPLEMPEALRPFFYAR